MIQEPILRSLIRHVRVFPHFEYMHYCWQKWSSNCSSAVNICQNLSKYVTNVYTNHESFINYSFTTVAGTYSLHTCLIMSLPFEFRISCFGNNFKLMRRSSMSDHHFGEVVPLWHDTMGNNQYSTEFLSIWHVLHWSKSSLSWRISGEMCSAGMNG